MGSLGTTAPAPTKISPPPQPGPVPDPSPHTPINNRTAQEIIAALNLIPHVEGGYYTQTFRDPAHVATTTTTTTTTTTNSLSPYPRPASTQIYYLLEGASGHSRWHRVTDAAEVWHWYAGAPLVLSLARDDGSPVREAVLGPDVFRGQRPQAVVARGEWQRARSLGEWTLVGATGR
ncbi:hypothetical protein VTK26DRAFT_4068 [Humicola hyalothermophila]